MLTKSRYAMMPAMVRILLIALTLTAALCGCEAMPDTLALKAQHQGHLVRVAEVEGPVQGTVNELDAAVRWKRGQFSAEAAEGYVLQCAGCARTAFHASAEYEFKLK